MARRVPLFLLLNILLIQISFAQSSSQKLSDRIGLDESSATKGTESPDLLSASDKPARPVARVAPMPRSVVSTEVHNLSPLEKAYLDAYAILRDDNQCSRFYGGPFAISALNQLIGQLKPTYLNHDIAMRMSGTETVFQSQLTGFSFRAFEKAEINLGGAFYRGNGVNERTIPSVARYQPNTRQSRLVVLLHELGHMVRGEGKKWLLADDGKNAEQSIKNSERVVGVCRQQIDAVVRQSSEEILANTRSEAVKPTYVAVVEKAPRL